MFSANNGKDCRSSFRHHSMFYVKSGRFRSALIVPTLLKFSVSVSKLYVLTIITRNTLAIEVIVRVGNLSIAVSLKLCSNRRILQ